MSSAGPHESSGTTWFVGASFGHTDDQSARFLKEGTWEMSSSSQKEQTLVRSMKSGERIANTATDVQSKFPDDDSSGPLQEGCLVTAMGTSN